MKLTGKILLRNRFKAWQGRMLVGSLWLIKVTFKASLLRRAFRWLLIRLVKKTGLFSSEYYIEDNPDVSETDISPLRHYVAYGDKEGRAPIPFFDPVFYRTQTRDWLKNVNALLHYVYIGRHLGLSPSPWFDLSFYLAHNKDVARSGIDPLFHYLLQGGLEGRSPCAQFDGAHYLRDNLDVVEMRINPLIHYMRYGRHEGRQTLPVMIDQEGVGESVISEIPRPALPSQKCWDELAPSVSLDQAAVDIVVPVYKGRTETLNCLHSVLLATTDTSFELVVINDASPDVDLVADLQRLAQQGLFTLLSNSENCGFVQTVNRGMSLHLDRDVVLLNSDTEVYDGWLDRLQHAALRNDLTATVTPLSNNATICSYPRFLHDNPYPLELSYKELNAVTAQVNSGVEVEVPTAVGFCMYIKRACLNKIGLFDAAQFGRGYGEENDFCQRAIKNGWRNIIASDVFVHHWGAASFQGEKGKLVQSALKILDRLHPSYHNDVAAFIDENPLLESRSRLDLSRMKRMCKINNVLIVNHNRGGGSERHVQEDVQRLIQNGYGVFMLRPSPKDPSHAIFSHPMIKSLPNLSSIALTDTSALVEALKGLKITEIHTHGLVDFVPEAPDHLVELIKSTGIRWEVNLHDYKVICPRINLVDGSGFYCEERSERYCNQCLSEQGSDFGVTDIETWRDMHHRALMLADMVLVPDQDVADRLKSYFPEVYFEVSPHEKIDLTPMNIRKPELEVNQRLRIVIIGAIGKIKGFEVLLACARDVKKRRLPIDFIVMGYSMNDRLLHAAGVTVTGRYLEENASLTLNALSPHVVWLPSVGPETYSYTLSIALQCQKPVIAFDIGAIARRLRTIGQTEGLVPLSMKCQPLIMNDFFLHRYRNNRSECA